MDCLDQDTGGGGAICALCSNVFNSTHCLFFANYMHCYVTLVANTYSNLNFYQAYSDDNSALCSYDLKIAGSGVRNKSLW